MSHTVAFRLPEPFEVVDTLNSLCDTVDALMPHAAVADRDRAVAQGALDMASDAYALGNWTEAFRYLAAHRANRAATLVGNADRLTT